MKIKGKITLLINRESTTIELEDDLACTVFAVIKLTPIQLNCALSRQGYVDCEIEVKGLDKLGKKHENKTFEFEIPSNLSNYETAIHNAEKLSQIEQNILDKEGEG